MPKSNATVPTTNHSQQATDESTSRMSDVALRKKKNADAQAAFRARRANYIATLEETVTSLESVVIQLQESCRETRHENQELRQDNARLRHELREREKYWRNLYQTKKTDPNEPDDPPLLPPSFLSSGGIAPMSMNQYGVGGPSYRMGDEASICHSPYANYSHHSSSLPYHVEGDISGNALSNVGHRGSKYPSFSYVPSVTREGQWPSPITQSASSGAESGAHSSHSPSFMGSPTLNSADMSFGGRFPPEDQKMSLSSLDAAPYAFPSSRSISPSTTPSSTSTSLTPFQFTFSESDNGQDRPDHDYRRHSHPHGAEVTLHGGTADVSLVGPASDTVRYRLANRREPGPSERPLLPILPHMSGSENDHGSSDGDTSYHSRPHIRRRMSHSQSRSPSPTPPILSGTLAVIKAQAFGALRRTRARTKRSSEGAAKVAMNVLEARGIGMPSSPGTPNLKRQRLDDEIDIS
ncbi:hypothetical protein DXG01_000200 [Tephrocybe rancida]|nr:hypothetical protein DXG01_000200 [Tephrocybe rancida]